MRREVKCVCLEVVRAGRAFGMCLPSNIRFLRAGISPEAHGAPSLWYTASIGSTQEDEFDFIVVMDNAEVPDKSEHIGMWWEGNLTFHLFMLGRTHRKETPQT